MESICPCWTLAIRERICSNGLHFLIVEILWLSTKLLKAPSRRFWIGAGLVASTSTDEFFEQMRELYPVHESLFPEQGRRARVIDVWLGPFKRC